MRRLLYSAVAATYLGCWALPLGAESKSAEPQTAKDVQAHDAAAKDAQDKDTQAKDAPIKDVQAKDAQTEADQPYQLVRTLERLQDRIAEGNTQAHGSQRAFIAEIAEKMLAASDETWAIPKNTRSAISYVLSGGDPRVLNKLLTMKSLPEISPALIKGVLAYSEGREAEALKTLGDIDHRTFDSRTGGHLALAKAMVAAKDDTARALGYLDDARLLCPGTLVEEAALRREVLLLAKAQDYARFEMLSFQYLRRFPKSVYAKSFSRSFAIAIASGSFGAELQFMNQLERRLDELPDDTRKQLYMTLAEEGVIRGRVELTRLAADRIAYLMKAGSREATRLQLYKAASLVVTSEYEFAVATLRNIDRTKLDSSDVQLLDGALALASQMRAPPQIAGPITEPPPLSSAAQVKHGAVAEKSEVLDRAHQALSQADALLNRTKP
jgi:chemotaxis protein MotC